MDNFLVSVLPCTLAAISLFRLKKLLQRTGIKENLVQVCLLAAVHALSLVWAATALSYSLPGSELSEGFLKASRDTGPALAGSFLLVIFGPEIGKLFSAVFGLLRTGLNRINPFARAKKAPR